MRVHENLLVPGYVHQSAPSRSVMSLCSISKKSCCADGVRSL